MRLKLLISLSLILSFGQTFGKNIHNNVEEEDKSPKEINRKSSKLSDNPFDDFMNAWLPKMEDEIDVPKLLEESKSAVDSMDSVFDHNKETIDSINKDFEDIKDFHKSMADLFFKQIFPPSESSDNSWEPIDPNLHTIVGNDEQKSSDIQETTESISSANKHSTYTKSVSNRGLPIFHPHNETEEQSSGIGSLFDKVFTKLIPILNIITEPEDQNKSTEQHLQTQPLDLDLEQLFEDKNESKPVDRDEEQGFPLFHSFVGSVFDSLAKIGNEVRNNFISELLSNNNTNGTEVDKMLVTDPLADGWVEFKMVDCKCPQAKYGIHREDCPMNEKHMNRSEDRHSVIDERTSAEEERLHVMERLSKEGMELYQDFMPFPNEKEIPITIEHSYKQEIRLIKDKDYEWYDWVLVSLIAGTSTLLLLTVLLMCIKRTRRSKSVELKVKNTVKGKNSKDLYKTAELSCKNENFSNKGIEKIKTICVNMQ